MSTHVVVRCPSCSQKYRLLPGYIGHRARCKRCATVFVVSAGDQPVDEDAIVTWITDEDPSSKSVMGSTGIFEKDAAHAMAADVAPPHPDPHRPAAPARIPPPPAPADTAGPLARLHHIDAKGAHFTFPAASLRRTDLRNAFPRKCLGCGTRTGLRVHLIHWTDRGVAQDAAPHRERLDLPVGRLEQFSLAGEKGLLEQLPRVRQAADPFNLPFPVFACEHCRPGSQLRVSVEHHAGGDVCSLTIQPLAIAVDFFRSVGGRTTPEYRQLIEKRDLCRDAWQELEGPTRHRIVAWLNLQDTEQFVGFYPDADCPPADSGTSGIVLTSHRVVIRKHALCRSYPLDGEARIEFITRDEYSSLHIYESGHAPLVLKLTRGTADNLSAALRKVPCQLVVTR